MHWLMVNHVSRLKKTEKPKMLVWRTEFGRGVFFGGKLNKPCGYWFCQKWLLIISKRPKKSSEWCYFILTPPTDHGTILRRSPHHLHFRRFNLHNHSCRYTGNLLGDSCHCHIGTVNRSSCVRGSSLCCRIFFFLFFFFLQQSQSNIFHYALGCAVLNNWRIQ